MGRVPLIAVERIETGVETTSELAGALAAIQRALEAAGVVFTNGEEPGVKLKAKGKAKGKR
jgi:microcompartment protein CcmL/EutN